MLIPGNKHWNVILSSSACFNHVKGGAWTQKTEALLSFLRLDILIFLLHLEHVEAGKLVSGARGIGTERGWMVYVIETKLQFDVPKQSISCEVGAILNEVVTQNLGKLMLDVQDCSDGERDDMALGPAQLLGEITVGRAVVWSRWIDHHLL